MAKIVINRERCKGCLLCVSFCPKGLIVVDEQLNQLGTRPAKSRGGEECSGCCLCAIICPDCCIEVHK